MDTGHSPSQPAFQFLESGVDGDAKPQCTVCGKFFKRMYALERHLLIHDPERTKLELKCPFDGCKFSSLQKSNVKTHIAAVHEKIKHACTLPRTPEDAIISGSSQSERCGRIFSDVPALIRHEKRAHGYYRRGVPAARARARSCKVSTQSASASRSVESPTREPASESESREQIFGRTSPSDEKVQHWLDGSDVRPASDMEYESEGVTPSATTFAHNETYNPASSQPSASVPTAVSTPATTASSISDGDSMTTASTSSFVSTSPSPAPVEPAPANHYCPPVSVYPPPCQQNYYYPYHSNAVPTYNTSRAYPLHPAQFGQQQTQNNSVFYDTGHFNPPIEEWFPQLAEMKRAMEEGGLPDGQTEWDGTISGLALLD